MRRFDAQSFTAAILAAVFIAGGGCMQPLLRPDNLVGFGSNRLTRPAPDELTAREKADACLATANELDKAGHAREAILLYEKARQHNPALKQVARRLAVLYDQEENSVRSQAEFQLALKHAPRDASLLSDYGNFYLRHGRTDVAEQWLRKALAVEKDHPEATNNLATLLARRGDYEESLKLFSKSVGPAAAHSNLGVILAKDGKTDLAKQHFEKSLSLDPTLRQPQAFLAYFEEAADGPEVTAGEKSPAR